MKMPEEQRYAIIGGPYESPEVRNKASLFDEIDGEVLVGGYTDARIPWPYKKKRGKHSLIVCGDLYKALQVESPSVVAYWWGVSTRQVSRWRIALGIGKTDGTRKLQREYIKYQITEEQGRMGRANALLPESLAKIGASSRSRGYSPEVIAKMRQINLGKKHSIDSRRKQSMQVRAAWKRGCFNHCIVWTEDRLREIVEIRNQGYSMPHIAKIKGVSLQQVIYALWKWRQMK